MMADVISGVMQMQKERSLKDYSTKELEIELARREKAKSHREARQPEE